MTQHLITKLMLTAIIIGSLACSDEKEVLTAATPTAQQILTENDVHNSAEGKTPTIDISTTPVPTATANKVQEPTPTAPPEPTVQLTITETPPATTVINTATPEIQETRFEDLGFSIVIENRDSIVLTSLLQENASSNQGILLFEYKGIQAVLMWMPAFDNSIQETQTQLMAILTGAQPENIFTVITEGSVKVDGNDGIFGVFSTRDSTSTVIGGGIIGAWECDGKEIIQALLVTGTDDTTVQIRFKRLIDSFTCTIS